MTFGKLQRIIVGALEKLNRLDDVSRAKMKIAFLIDDIEELEEKLSDIKTSLYILKDMLEELYMKELKSLSSKEGERNEEV